jgi:hypothetical protein
LQRVCFENEIEFLLPAGRRGQKVRGGVGDFGIWEAVAGAADRGFGNVEGRGLKTPVRELLGVIAETAADYDRGFVRGWLRMRLPEIEEMRVGGQVGPGDGGGAGFGFAVEGVEPAGGVVFLEILGGELSGAFAFTGWVGHLVDFS